MSAVAVQRGLTELDAREFEELRRFIHQTTGIALGDTKQPLVASRLGKRLRALGLASFTDYLRYLETDPTGVEAAELVNCITTNKTSFFREQHHFDVLARTVVPAIVERARRGGARRIRVWSTASSTGQEPWTIAMTLARALGSLAGWDVRILASDIDTNVLETAEAAVYDEEALADVPPDLRESAFERLSGGRRRVVAALRALVTFRRINLVAPPWPIRTKFDVVFCRNVAIYFDRPTQQRLFEDLAAQLEPDGYLMSGHSENLHWMSHVLRPAGSTVYRPTTAAAAPRLAAAPPPTRTMSGVRSAARARTSADADKPLVSIQAGGMHVAVRPTRIRTTLGSCVAACLWDPARRIGGMNHFMLPEAGTSSRPLATFGVHAMEMLVNAVMKAGADRSRIVAKVFGGSDVLSTGGGAGGVGAQNASFVLGYLADEGIPVIGQKLGTTSALSVELDTESGRVLVRTIDRDAALARVEGELTASIARAARESTRIDDAITVWGAR